MTCATCGLNRKTRSTLLRGTYLPICGHCRYYRSNGVNFAQCNMCSTWQRTRRDQSTFVCRDCGIRQGRPQEA